MILRKVAKRLLGKRLKDLRMGKTQQQISDLLGISRARYSHYENEHVQPDNEMLSKMANLHGVSIDYLLGRTDEKNKELSDDARRIIDALNLSDEEVMQTLKLEIDGILLTPEQVRDFVNYVRVDRTMKKQATASDNGNH